MLTLEEFRELTADLPGDTIIRVMSAYNEETKESSQVTEMELPDCEGEVDILLIYADDECL